jgi:hypothetical protein
MPVVAAVILIALLYWLWPVLLLGAVIWAGIWAFRKKKQQVSSDIANAIIPRLKGRYCGLYGVQQGYKVKCIRIDEVRLGDHTRPFIVVEWAEIFWDDNQSDEFIYKFVSADHSSNMSDLKGDFSTEDQCYELIINDIDSYLTHAAISLHETGSLDSEVVAILFNNLPEAQWASQSIALINDALSPLIKTHEASLSNELLAANSSEILRAIQLLEAESEKLIEYSSEALVAMKKAYEFLCAPASFRKFQALDTRPLEIYSKQQEMREGFENTLAIKEEYDNLRN